MQSFTFPLFLFLLSSALVAPQAPTPTLLNPGPLLPLQQQLVPNANPPPPLAPPWPSDLNMPVSRDFLSTEVYHRMTAPDANQAPFPIPNGYPQNPVGMEGLTLEGATTGFFTPASQTGPVDPDGSVTGSVNFTIVTPPNPGPVYPIYAADAPLASANAFGAVPQVGIPSTYNPTPTFASPSCNSSLLLACTKGLSGCLGAQVSPSPSQSFNSLGLPALVDVGARGGLCACFFTHGQCYAAAGCLDALPQPDVDYCFNVLHCPLPKCQGNGVGRGVVLGGVAILLLATLSLATLFL